MDKDRLSKLTAALYRVSDLMPNEEPLKWGLRKIGVSLYELVSLAQNESAPIKERMQAKETIDRLVDDLLRLLDLARSATFVSDINHSVLVREYRSVTQSLHRLEEGDAIVKLPAPRVASERPASVMQQPEQVSAAQVPQSERAPITQNSPTQPRKMNIPPTSASSREGRILDFLAAHPWSGRGELMSLFGGEMSEKTLQRTLVTLLESEKIQKQGDKRWCRYALSA